MCNHQRAQKIRADVVVQDHARQSNPCQRQKDQPREVAPILIYRQSLRMWPRSGQASDREGGQEHGHQRRQTDDATRDGMGDEGVVKVTETVTEV